MLAFRHHQDVHVRVFPVVAHGPRAEQDHDVRRDGLLGRHRYPQSLGVGFPDVVGSFPFHEWDLSGNPGGWVGGDGTTPDNPTSSTRPGPASLFQPGTDVGRQWKNAPWGVRDSNSPNHSNPSASTRPRCSDLFSAMRMCCARGRALPKGGWRFFVPPRMQQPTAAVGEATRSLRSAWDLGLSTPPDVRVPAGCTIQR